MGGSAFHSLRYPDPVPHGLHYAVHVRRSSQFKASHSGGSSSSSGDGKKPETASLLEGPPSLELFETVTTTCKGPSQGCCH